MRLPPLLASLPLLAACAGDPAAATDVPSTDASVTDVPRADAAASDLPTTDVNSVDTPRADAPATDVPAIDAPATDAPATDAPATDAPATDAPATDAPATDAPARDVQRVDGCVPPTVDGSEIGTSCRAAMTCSAGYRCTAQSGVVLNMLCQIPCATDCDCPDAFACRPVTDKAGTMLLCVRD